jgi:hypothetical protein
MAKPKVGDVSKQGKKVRASGVYVVVHHGHKVKGHEVTCIAGHVFPPCRSCGKKVRYKAVRLAHHAARDKRLGKKTKK